MSTDIEGLIRRWQSRLPGAVKAHLQDPQYHAQVTWMGRMLAAMDMAMEDEGIPESTRLRIVRTVVYGGPDETEALARVEAMNAQVEALKAEPAKLMVDVTDIWRRRP